MLYVTDLSGCDSPFGALKELVPLQKKLFDRIVFALPASLQGGGGDLPDPGIPFTTKTIADISFREVVAAARDVTFIKAAVGATSIPCHVNMGMGVGGIPMLETPPIDAVTRASKAMVEIAGVDGI